MTHNLDGPENRLVPGDQPNDHVYTVDTIRVLQEGGDSSKFLHYTAANHYTWDAPNIKVEPERVADQSKSAADIRREYQQQLDKLDKSFIADAEAFNKLTTEQHMRLHQYRAATDFAQMFFNDEVHFSNLSRGEQDILAQKMRDYVDPKTSQISRAELAKSFDQMPALKAAVEVVRQTRAHIPDDVLATDTKHVHSTKAMMDAHLNLMSDLYDTGYNQEAEAERARLIELGRQVNVEIQIAPRTGGGAVPPPAKELHL